MQPHLLVSFALPLLRTYTQKSNKIKHKVKTRREFEIKTELTKY